MNTFDYLPSRSVSLGGYAGKMIDFTIAHQYCDPSLWALLVNQFRIHSDTAGEWRGEFWGKLMRGACLTYEATGDAELYSVLQTTVLDFLSTQDPDGRFSSYPRGKELYGWDVWGRKYAAIGLLSFYSICQEENLKATIVRAVERHFDCLLEQVGPGKKDLLDTSDLYGAMNSASIINPMLSLYRITHEEKYLAFAKAVVKEGMCKGFDLVEACLENKLYPYQFKELKVYEEMSCIEGLLSLYTITGEPEYLRAGANFVQKVVASDYTLIGCCGCRGEFFDHSTETQTSYVEGALQETCVTVTFIGLCVKLLSLTGSSFYADCIERSAYNALYGAVNNTEQEMCWIKGAWIRKGEEFIDVPHGGYPFDSYSPLYWYARGRQIGGFQLMQDGKSYGCCACNGGRGTALVNRFALMRFGAGFAVNFYNDLLMKTPEEEIRVKADLYHSGKIEITLAGRPQRFPLALRLPVWAASYHLEVDGHEVIAPLKNGYLIVERTWEKDTLVLDFPLPVVAHLKNGKVAFSRGPIILARDRRFGDKDVELASFADGAIVQAKEVANPLFESNLTLEIPTGKGAIRVCDYSQAGKDYDQKESLISVWSDLAVD
jgi:DUF1680 family protein